MEIERYKLVLKLEMAEQYNMHLTAQQISELCMQCLHAKSLDV